MVRPGPAVKKELTSEPRELVNTELCYAYSQAKFSVLENINYGYVLTTHGSGHKRGILNICVLQ